MGELVDLVNRQGEVVSPAVQRGEASSYRHQGLYMQVVVGVIFDGLGRVLVEGRGTGKDGAGKIDLICGAVKAGEMPRAAIVREAQEECGITIGGLDTIREGVNTYDSYRYLFSGTTDQEPGDLNRREVDWAEFRYPAELAAWSRGDPSLFMDEVIEDIMLAADGAS